MNYKQAQEHNDMLKAIAELTERVKKLETINTSKPRVAKKKAVRKTNG